MFDDDNSDDRGDDVTGPAPVGELLKLVGEDPGKPPSLDQLMKEAQAYGKRRADREGSRDNLIYRTGYAMDAMGALAVEPEVLAGVLSDFSIFEEVLHHLMRESFDGPVITLALIAVANSPALTEWARQVGRCLQWNRLHALQQASTASFKNSGAHADPEAGWRRKPPKREQLYLVGEIARLTGQVRPVLKTRGEAFDYIDTAGGNPRYWTRPTVSKRPKIWP